MKFDVKRRIRTEKRDVNKDDYDLAKSFAHAMKEELNDMLKVAVLFGSTARNDSELHESDIDVLLIVDDLTLIMSAEVIEAYRIITEKTAAKVSKRLHITTMRLTNFWEYVRSADPVAVNVLRDGMILHDTGIFEPVQQLLFDGRIKPTRESVYAYFARAPMTMTNADWHVTQAAMDLYWAVIDAAHAALMHVGCVPPSPKDVAHSLDERLVKPGHLASKHVKTMTLFFDLHKNIVHRKITRVTGSEYEDYRIRAKEFITEMEHVIAKR